MKTQGTATGNQKDPKEIFGKLYGRPVSDDEVSEIRINLLGFFETLQTIDQRLKQKTKQQND